MKDHALFVKLFHKNSDCALVVLKKFLSLKGMKKDCGPMSDKDLKKMIMKFEETGFFEMKSCTVGSKIVRVLEIMHVKKLINNVIL